MQMRPRSARGLGAALPAQGDAADETTGVVGVLGGMGPLATVDFLRKMLQATPAATDQDHVPVVVSSIPQVPDRTLAFRGEGASPLTAMVASGQRLLAAGAGLVVMPCNTAHLWFDALQANLKRPMLHLVDAALDEAAGAAGPGARIGLLATDATLASGLYVNRAQRHAAAVQWLLPTATEMLDDVMPGIAAVKAGRLDAAREALQRALQALQRRGAQAVVLGCTEIPIVLEQQPSGVPLVDATAALARRAVAWALAQREAAEAVA